MNGNWNRDLQKGAKGEDRVINYLNQKFIVNDTRNDVQYQNDDIDFVLTNKNNITFTFELKTDYRIGKTGNILFATYNDRQTGRYKDWALKTKADYIGVFDINNDKLYIIDWNNFSSHLNDYRQISWYNYSDNCTSYGRLASINSLIDKEYIIQTIDIAKYCA